MNQKKSNIIYNISIIIFTVLSLFCAIILFINPIDLKLWIRICSGVGLILIALTIIILRILKIHSWAKIFFILDIVLLIIFGAYYLIWANDWLQYFNSVESIKNLILSTGIWGKLVFVLIQFLQVVAIPIPALITTLAGVAIFGPFETLILSLIGVVLGSLASFLVGRWFGRPICEWVAGKENTKKYADLLSHRGKFLLPIMFLLPVFPDDIICMIAGVTTMTMRFFFISVLLFRPIGIIATCYLGSGQLIPFSGWGLFVWPFIIIFLIFLFWFCFKYQDKIENYFKEKFSKNEKQSNNNENLKSTNELNCVEEKKQINNNDNSVNIKNNNDNVKQEIINEKLIEDKPSSDN